MLRKKGNNVATIAVARKLVTAMCYILRGFSSPLEELDKTTASKLRKIGTVIGKELRQESGSDTLDDFFINLSKKIRQEARNSHFRRGKRVSCLNARKILLA